MKNVFLLIFLSLLIISCAQEGESSKSLINDTPNTTPEAEALENIMTSIIEPANATYANGGGELLFQINFSSAVMISASARLVLDIGGSTVYADYKSGTSSTGIEFSYLIQAGDNDSDGIEYLITNIDLNGGTLKKLSDLEDISTDFSDHVESMNSVLVNTNSGITAPDQVTGVTTAPTTQSDELSVAWSVPNNNGTTISHYSVQYREQGQSAWTSVTPNPSSNSTTISGLAATVIYEIRVAADNGLLGQYSATSNAEVFDISALNPIAWLSATNITNGGTEPVNGDKISAWSDLSGVATDAVESTVARQPTYETDVFNGLPAVRFNGEAQGLLGTYTRNNNAGLTVVLVAKMDTNNSREAFFEFYSNTNSARGFFFNYGFNEASTNHQLNDTSLNLWSAYDNGTHTDLYENGQTIYTDRPNWGNGKSTAFTGAGSYLLGDDQTGGDEFHGYIAEFLIFDRELTTSELSSLEEYLKNKWGTP
ncbi:MAG: fibronectin type III domain-containing protein [Bacteriovoracaceae bacterium]|jgi:hypothetical protein|nr:hypothetical protein [Halobacteriovoraceae bacterium]MDP7321522.1 fibronectin type III domain-containing protein [Bacteriovoracaceae bacterium]